MEVVILAGGFGTRISAEASLNLSLELDVLLAAKTGSATA